MSKFAVERLTFKKLSRNLSKKYENIFKEIRYFMHMIINRQVNKVSSTVDAQ